MTEAQHPHLSRPEVAAVTSRTRVVLGIDAAWTETQPSGVALAIEEPDGWRCIAVAPNYETFISMSAGGAIDWRQRSFGGTAPSISRLLDAAQQMAGAAVDVIAVDMPIATVPFSSRRAADSAVSREFGARKCSTHSPSAARPGRLGANLSSAFIEAGFALATSKLGSAGPALIEVYPHPALLSLLGREERVRYKVSKASKYWPNLNSTQRLGALLSELQAIYAALEAQFGPLPFEFPERTAIMSCASLKRYEDALDALVCAWMGVQYLQNRATPLGNATAAIWCPTDVIRNQSEGL